MVLKLLLFWRTRNFQGAITTKTWTLKSYTCTFDHVYSSVNFRFREASSSLKIYHTEIWYFKIFKYSKNGSFDIQIYPDSQTKRKNIRLKQINYPQTIRVTNEFINLTANTSDKTIYIISVYTYKQFLEHLQHNCQTWINIDKEVNLVVHKLSKALA